MVTQTYTCKEIKKTKLKEGREVGEDVRGGRGREGGERGERGREGGGEKEKEGERKGGKTQGPFPCK